MCIKVFKKEVNIYYRFICLLPFIIVILFLNNVVTYILLAILLFIDCLRRRDFLFLIMSLITFIFFLINNLLLIKLILITDYIMYFMISKDYIIDNDFDNLYTSNRKEISNLLEKGEIDDKIMKQIYIKTKFDIKMRNEYNLLRFKKNNNIHKDNLNNILYISSRLIILFLSILIGSCVI